MAEHQPDSLPTSCQEVLVNSQRVNICIGDVFVRHDNYGSSFWRIMGFIDEGRFTMTQHTQGVHNYPDRPRVPQRPGELVPRLTSEVAKIIAAQKVHFSIRNRDQS